MEQTSTTRFCAVHTNGRGSPARGVTTKHRDVRTIVELGKAIDFDARTAIPFEGERHNALDDARYAGKIRFSYLAKTDPESG
ncbi:3'-5' exoribonuclease domain-containing protein [Escherichia coli]|uniref:3'-5' exoribonuclease domain-containing protein n=1 Tax=Escherichia coli TaxID=562 RepID=UPI003B281C3F